VSADTMKMVCHYCQRAELKDNFMRSNRPRDLSPLQPYFLFLLPPPPPTLPLVLARTVSVLTDGKLNISFCNSTGEGYSVLYQHWYDFQWLRIDIL